MVAALQADWPLNDVRWYGLDGRLGDNLRVGFSDGSSAESGVKAKKTLLGLSDVFPRSGADRKVCVNIRAGDYTGQGGLDVLLAGTSGWAPGYPVVVVTDDVPSAGAAAFMGDAADRTALGMRVADGTNAAGYAATGAPSAAVVQCLKVGGGDPGFAVEPALPLGARMRFVAGTPTAALRNQCRKIRQVEGTDTLVPLSAFPAAPSTDPLNPDVFVVEEPAAIFDATTINYPGLATFPVAGFQFDGLTILNGQPNLAGCLVAGAASVRGGNLAPLASYTDENGTTHVQGMGLRVNGPLVTSLGGRLNGTLNPNLALMTTLNTSISGEAIFAWTSGAQAWGGVLVQGCPGIATNNATQPPSTVGGRSHVGEPPSRIRGVVNAVSPGKAAGLLVVGSSLTLDHLDFAVGGHPAIALNGNCVLSMSEQQSGGAAANGDVGLDLTGAVGSRVVLYGLPSVTGALGDVRLSDGTIASWAQAMAGLKDGNGNVLYSPGNAP